VPELPEVETVRRSLEPALFQGRVTAVHTSVHALRRRAPDRKGLAALVGARFVAARRHGKYLLLDTDRGTSLLVHLGMSGQLLLADADAAPPKHTHVELSLSSRRALRFVDPRRFGLVRVYPTEALAKSEELAGLGPDPLGGGFTVEALATAMQRTRRDLKSVLMDQRVLAGLGNIYVSEALFAARLSPFLAGERLRPPQVRALHHAIERVLARAVRNRGTSLSDYVDARGESGANQHRLLVYDRAEKPCRRCKTPIRRTVQGGRSTYYCARCQAAGPRGRSRT
jgi:formamidopyrimidine-DNA glycosylase